MEIQFQLILIGTSNILDDKISKSYVNIQNFCLHQHIYLKNGCWYIRLTLIYHTSVCVCVCVYVTCMNNLNNAKLSAADACNIYAKVNRNRHAHTRINTFFLVYPPPESPTYIIIRSNEVFHYLHVLC